MASEEESMANKKGFIWYVLVNKVTESTFSTSLKK